MAPWVKLPDRGNKRWKTFQVLPADDQEMYQLETNDQGLIEAWEGAFSPYSELDLRLILYTQKKESIQSPFWMLYTGFTKAYCIKPCSART